MTLTKEIQYSLDVIVLLLAILDLDDLLVIAVRRLGQDLHFECVNFIRVDLTKDCDILRGTGFNNSQLSDLIALQGVCRRQKRSEKFHNSVLCDFLGAKLEVAFLSLCPLTTDETPALCSS